MKTTARPIHPAALLLLAALAAPPTPANAQTGQYTWLRQRAPLTATATPPLRADEAQEQTVLIDEDFSRLTAGTEDEPDTENLVNSLGDLKQPDLFHTYSATLAYRTWGGEGLYSAGGALAIRDGWFLNTPAGDMGGEVTLTFRARLTEGATSADGQGAMDLILLSRKSLIDYERRQIDLTPEWQTFSFTSTRGSYEATGLQFMCNTTATVLLDDIHLTQRKQSIAAPKAQEPIDADEYAFTAVWQPTTDATSYLLDVYSKEQQQGDDSHVEQFATINASADGVIDATAPGYPTGWDIHWTDPTHAHLAQGLADNSHALILSDAGDYIEMPRCAEGLTQANFRLRLDAVREDIPYGSYLQLYADTDYGLIYLNYIDVADMLQWADPVRGEVVDLKASLGLVDRVYAIRWEYFPAEGDDTRLLVEQVSWAQPMPPTLHYLLQDEPVDAPTTGEASDEVTFTVDNLDPDTDYYYTVRARNDRFTSASSNEVEVYTVSRPETLEPTDITAESYTARWTSHNKVDLYRVEQLRLVEIPRDTAQYEILWEDFARVTSDFKESDIAEGFIEQGTYTDGYQPIDDLTHIAGWKASSLQWVEGWLGGMAAGGPEGTIAGAITTPRMDLSHNDGECTVELRAWGQTDDWLVIQGLNAACYGAVRFPEGGFVETSVSIPCCTAREQLTFYSNNYQPFLIDYIRILQPLRQGDRVEVVTASQHTANAKKRALLMETPDFAPTHTVAYRVTGLRYRHGDQKDVVASEPSEVMVVPNPTTAITSPASSHTAQPRVTATPTGVSITTSQPTPVSITTLSGQTRYAATLSTGTTTIHLPRGLYLVRIDDDVVRVAVR